MSTIIIFTVKKRGCYTFEVVVIALISIFKLACVVAMAVVGRNDAMGCMVIRKTRSVIFSSQLLEIVTAVVVGFILRKIRRSKVYGGRKPVDLHKKFLEDQEERD